MKKFLLALVCAFLLLSSSLCFATSEFSNLSPAGTVYNPWYTLGMGYTQGFGFTANSTDNLNNIQIVLGNTYWNHGNGDPIISLYSADSNWTKGTLLESWVVDHTTLAATEANDWDTTHVTTLTSISHAMLTAGSNYWIIGTNDADTNTAWYLNNLANYGMYYSLYGAGEGSISRALAGAFAVNASPFTPTPTPTPEPTTMLLLGLGLAGLAGLRKKI